MKTESYLLWPCKQLMFSNHIWMPIHAVQLLCNGPDSLDGWMCVVVVFC